MGADEVEKPQISKIVYDKPAENETSED